MAFRELDVVALSHDLPEHGLRKGDLGAVVLVYDAGNFEVEFTLPSGKTKALLTLPAAALQRATDREVQAIRSALR